MIGKIKGTLAELDGNIGLIETPSGVSYSVFLTSQVLSTCLYPCPIEVYTYLHVREDALILFGFQNREEYQLFTLLLSVSGVGPKTAFGVISATRADELITAIKSNEVAYFTKVPGLGKKTAMKIILELSQKLKQEFKMEKMYLSDDDQTVIDALVSLGFKVGDAKNILTKIPKDLTLEEKIQEGLRFSTKKLKK